MIVAGCVHRVAEYYLHDSDGFWGWK